MIDSYQLEFYKHLSTFDREKTLNYAMDLLNTGKVDVVQLYENIISPSLKQIMVCRQEEDTRIWQEHIMTNIARTVVECSFPYVLKQRNAQNKENSAVKIVIACPLEETHDIGARMGADYFTMENYHVMFVGGDTPHNNLVSVCEMEKPQYLAISVSNFYHIPSVKNTIAEIHTLPSPPKVILSGSAFIRTQVDAKEMGAIALINTYAQVKALGGNA